MQNKAIRFDCQIKNTKKCNKECKEVSTLSMDGEMWQYIVKTLDLYISFMKKFHLINIVKQNNNKYTEECLSMHCFQ